MNDAMTAPAAAVPPATDWRSWVTRSLHIRDAADWAQSDPKVLAGRVAMWASL